MKSIPRLFARRRRLNAAAVSGASVAEAVATGVCAFATRDIFAALHDGARLSLVALALLAGGGVVVALMRVLSRTVAERLGQSYAIDVRQTLYRHLAGLSVADASARRAGALALRFVGDLSAARNWVSMGATHVISALIVLPGAALTLWLIQPVLALAAAVPLLISLLLMVAVAVLVQPLHRRLRSKRAGIAITMMERAGMAPELDLLGRSQRELESLNREGEALQSIATKRVLVQSSLAALPHLGSSLAGLAVLWTAAMRGLPAADAAATLAVLAILTAPLGELARVWDRYCAWRVAREKCEIVLRQPSSRRRVRRRGTPPPIHFKAVQFRGLFLDVSIQPGEIVAVTGPPAGGKSSFLSLAASLDRPDAGEVSFGDGERLPVIAVINARSPIPQGSLRRALTLGLRKRPNDPTIAAMARVFKLEPLLTRLGGLDGKVAEHGRNLAEAERWRLLMVRVALMSPDVLIVDSGPMSESEDLRADLAVLTRQVRATTLIACADSQRPSFATRGVRIVKGEMVEAPADMPESTALEA